MSKNDVIINLVIDLNVLVDGINGFSSLIPEGTEHDEFNLSVKMFLRQVACQLKESTENALNLI
ncbi:hypothetical protein [Actinobacillus pleuropneumoniae]|uniref:hypothetical protein n=1 Tax=Actinobacillus pleuropneumoniae TaxID=715 RepID=UPI003B0243B2